MRIDKIKSIADKVSKKYDVPLPIATRLDKNRIELRTELPSYEGGWELQEKIMQEYPDVIAENQGGCVYIVYKPL